MMRKMAAVVLIGAVAGCQGVQEKPVAAVPDAQKAAATLPAAVVPATRPAVAAGNGTAWGPEILPGKGLAAHPFMYSGEAMPLRVVIVRDGKIDWSYTYPATKGEVSDATMLSNGNVLFAYQFGAVLVSPEKKILWSHAADAGCEIHTVCPMGLDKVAYIQNGDPAKLVVENMATGKVENTYTLQTGNPKTVHGQFRRLRVTAAGTFLVTHMDLGKVVEYDGSGLELKEVWSYAIKSPWSAVRLKNGNTLIATNGNVVREVNKAGETVWELTQADVPEIKLFGTQTAGRLANGDTVINNWKSPSGGNFPVQAFEVTPDKKVVWALREWKDPNLGASTNIQFLDEPGKAENAELQR